MKMASLRACLVVLLCACALVSAADIPKFNFEIKGEIQNLDIVVRENGDRSAPAVRIVGGTEVTAPNPYPWAAFLLFGCPDTGAVASCTGSVISKNVVLTAGHCWMFDCPSPVQGIAQVGLSTQQPEEVLALKVQVGHPDYNQQTLLNDIAVWIMEADFATVSQFGQLPGGDASEGTAVIAAGWGVTDNGQGSDVLREVTLEVQPNSLCGELFRGFEGSTQICAGVDGGGKDTCNGDSGGPLFTDRTVHGLTSYGSADCGALDGAVYTRISAYRSWVQAASADNGGASPSTSSSTDDSTIWIIVGSVAAVLVVVAIIAFIVIKKKSADTPDKAGRGEYRRQGDFA